MDNYADYVCYLLGCQDAGIEPLEEWRFHLLQQEYLRRASETSEAGQPAVPPFVLEQLARLVAEGYRIAASGGGDSQRSDSSEEPGSAACGVREPRRPLEPVLAGSAARSWPTLDTPDQSFWRT